MYRRLQIGLLIVLILGIGVTVFYLTRDSSKDADTSETLPSGRSIRTDIPLNEQVDDLNDDGERNILDLILEINGG